MTKRLRLKLLLALISMSGAPLFAQQQGTRADSVEAPDEIVVIGQQKDDASVRRDAALFAQKVSATPIAGQMARWKDPICPTAIGVDQKIANIVDRRVRNLAARIGAAVAKDNCKANLFVIFTPDANGLMGEIMRRRATIFTATEPAELKALRKSAMPIRWWYGSTTEGTDGRPLTLDPGGALLGINLPRSGRERYRVVSSLTRIDTDMRVNIDSATVLVDTVRSDGHKLSSVVDYAAFVALARIGISSKFDGVPSILNIFASGDQALSDWDVAYLSALYRAPIDRPARDQRQFIASEMYRALGK